MGDTSTNGANLDERLPTIRELLGSVNTSAVPGLTPINGTKSTGWTLCGRVTAARPRPAMTVLNTPGTVDEGYRGEVGVILINHGATAFTVEAGMKIAQMVVSPRIQVAVVEVPELSDTQRGAGGFGSTGH